MRLTAFLSMNKSCLPYRFRGKKRAVPEITDQHLEDLQKDLEREEENMFYLRNPYLTKEETDGLPEYRRKLYELYLDGQAKKQFKNFYKIGNNRKLTDVYPHLKISEKWDSQM